MCYEEIEDITLFVCGDMYMLYKIGAIEKVVNWMDCESRGSST